MKHSHGLCCVLFVAACTTSNDDAKDLQTSSAEPPGVADPDPTEQAAPADTDPTEQAPPADRDPTEQAAPAGFPIPAPDLTTGGSSTVTVTTSLAGSGLQIDGGVESASYALASFMIETGAMRATAEFTVNPAPGASFTYALRGTGGGYSSRYLRLQRVPGSDDLQAVSENGAVTCGTLASGQPTAVTLAFDGAARRFDVFIAGQPSPCTDLPTRTSGPVTGFRVTDETVAGYGGHVELTSLALFGSP